MKKGLFKVALLAVVALSSLNSCKKSTTSPSTNTTPAFNATMNGTATTFTGSASSGSTYLTLTGTGSNYTIKIYYQMPIQVGTAITLGAPGGNYASVTTGANQLWETSSTSTGTITITANTNNTVTGTFSFTGAPISGSGNMNVTSGSFNYISY